MALVRRAKYRAASSLYQYHFPSQICKEQLLRRYPTNEERQENDRNKLSVAKRKTHQLPQNIYISYNMSIAVPLIRSAALVILKPLHRGTASRLHRPDPFRRLPIHSCLLPCLSCDLPGTAVFFYAHMV